MISPALESLINRLAAQAHAERRRMLRDAIDAVSVHIARTESDRRSLGQFLRFARQRLTKETS